MTSRHLGYFAFVATVAVGLSAGTMATSAQTGSQAPQLPISAASSHPSAVEILKSAIAALAGVESVEYDARQLDGYGTSGAKQPGRTRVLAARSPFRYSARLQTDDASRVEMAVSDGTTTRASDAGTATEAPARAIVNNAAADALVTGSLFDRDLYSKALSSGNVLYAGRDDVDGDLCYVIAYVTLMDQETGSDTRYYWISAQTGLPRSYQSWRLLRGKTLLTVRWTISNVRVNPAIPEATFAYVPTAADSTRAPAPAPLPAAKVLDGTLVPDLNVRDTAYKPVSLASLQGQATILTFWAPWCGPCVGEMRVLNTLQENYRGQLQIAAVAVKDSRLNIDRWIAKNPQFRFRFLIDGELGRSPTAIESFFDVQGIPVSVFLNADGRIITRWSGFNGADELTAKINALMAR
jgi:thiol-disulfide isomerase/thioredoxin/outer membrane lipoprotein-sorting protein